MAVPANEHEVLSAAQELYRLRNYAQLKAFISANRDSCSTDEVKLKMLKLWENAVYWDFLDTRQTGGKDDSQHQERPADNQELVKALLSSSMRYKLRKKHPCPIELEQELRVKNARLAKHVHDGLNAWLKRHREHPYPNKQQKEELAASLGISPQQVNRWFIQRRKMLKIRGRMYLGRGIADDEEDNGSEDGDDALVVAYDDMEENSPSTSPALADGRLQPAAANNVVLLVQGSEDRQQPSMLENILRSHHHHQEQQAQTVTMMTGGSMEVLDQFKSRSRLATEEMPLTPPPSVSGESVTHRGQVASGAATPEPSFNATAAPLDLTVKAEPVILERHSPPQPHFNWKKAIIGKEEENAAAAFSSEDMEAASALLFLSRS